MRQLETFICDNCGTEATRPWRGRNFKRKFCSRSCNRPPSDPREHPRYNGGIQITTSGYAFITGRNGEHTKYARAVMEASLGRELRSDEIVHHQDGNPSNDALENLRLVSRGEHALLHDKNRNKLGQYESSMNPERIISLMGVYKEQMRINEELKARKKEAKVGS